MMAAVLVRNLDDRFRLFGIQQGTVEEMQATVLPLFIAMAMLTLKLWELAVIAWPLMIILLVQAAVTWLFSAAVVFRVLGRTYASAVMTAGFCGFMIGITPNALASMEELARKYGPGRQAFWAVPLVGAALMDFTNPLVVTAFLKWFG